MFEIIVLSIKIIVILFFVGYGFTALFVPKSLRQNAIWFCPWIGTILISVLSVLFSLAKVAVFQSAYIIIAIAALFLLFSLLTKKKLSIISKESLLLAILTIFSIFYNLFPLLTRAGFPTAISLSNLDPLSYSPVGDFLVNHTVFDGGTLEHYKPFLWATGDLLHAGFRWGSPIILSFFSRVLNLQAYQIYSVLITIYFAFSFPLVYILAKKLCGKWKYCLMILIFLTFAMNSTLLYMLYNVFYAQFIFSGIFIFIIIFAHTYISDFNSNSRLNFNVYDLFIALGISSITTVYSEGLIFVLLPLVIFTVFSFFFRTRTGYIHFLFLLKILILVLLINPVTAGTALQQNIKTFASSAKILTNIGWEKIRFAQPIEILGIYNLYYYKYLHPISSVLSSLPITAISIIGLIYSRKKLFSMAYITVYIPFLIGLRWIFPNFFSYHRLVTYILFLFSIFFSIGLTYLLTRIKIKSLQISIVMVLVLLIFYSANRTIYQFYWHPYIVDNSLVSLTELNNDSAITKPFYTSDVYLGEYNLWKRLWREYFLMDKQIVTRQNYSTEKKYLDGMDLVLSEKNVLQYNGKNIVYKNIVWENKYYKLGKIIPMPVAEDLQ